MTPFTTKLVAKYGVGDASSSYANQYEVEPRPRAHYESNESPIAHGAPFSGKVTNSVTNEINSIQQPGQLSASPNDLIAGVNNHNVYSQNSPELVNQKIQSKSSISGQGILKSPGESPLNHQDHQLTNNKSNNTKAGIEQTANPRFTEKNYSNTSESLASDSTVISNTMDKLLNRLSQSTAVNRMDKSSAYGAAALDPLVSDHLSESNRDIKADESLRGDLKNSVTNNPEKTDNLTSNYHQGLYAPASSPLIKDTIKQLKQLQSSAQNTQFERSKKAQSTTQYPGQLNNQPAVEEPVINITIGRVDVKAKLTDTISSTAASTDSNKPRGLISLESYLKQRNGGDL